ncbi:MAG TPA: hypothetical protein VLA35_01870, partial [Thermoleophilia bacterium]|nr:hypothetical protein [Thermoleophilia bacterium]
MRTIDLGQIRAVILAATDESAGEGDAFVAGLARPAADRYRRLQLRGVAVAGVRLDGDGGVDPALLVDAARRFDADPAT